MKITEEQARELLSEWESIGMNDCNPPRRELDDLFNALIEEAVEEDDE